MKKAIVAFAGLTMIALGTYAGYYLIKTVSYNLFYKSMVQKEIRQMVINSSLK